MGHRYARTKYISYICNLVNFPLQSLYSMAYKLCSSLLRGYLNSSKDIKYLIGVWVADMPKDTPLYKESN